MIYDRGQILTIFEKANVPPRYPEGATQEQLRELDKVSYRTAYMQWAYDSIVKRQENPVYQKIQDKYPLLVESIARCVMNFDEDRQEGNGALYPGYETALGFYPWGSDERPHRPGGQKYFKHARTVDPLDRRSNPELSELDYEEIAARKRAAGRERTARCRARAKAEAEAQKREAALQNQKDEQKTFAEQFAVRGDQNAE